MKMYTIFKEACVPNKDRMNIWWHGNDDYIKRPALIWDIMALTVQYYLPILCCNTGMPRPAGLENVKSPTEYEHNKHSHSMALSIPLPHSMQVWSHLIHSNQSHWQYAQIWLHLMTTVKENIDIYLEDDTNRGTR